MSCQNLFDHARTLVADLCLEREATQVGDEGDATAVLGTEGKADEQAADHLRCAQSR